MGRNRDSFHAKSHLQSGDDPLEHYGFLSGSFTTTGTTEQLLGSIAIPAYAFSRNGHGLHILAGFVHAANSRSATAYLRLGGLAGTLLTSMAYTLSGAGGIADLYVVRVNATTAQVWGSLNRSGGGLEMVPATISITPGVPTTLDFTALTGSGAGDLTLNALLVNGI